jgi:hypothetical protein
MNYQTMNGASVIARARDTIFVRIPEQLQAPIDGGCCCDYCTKAKERNQFYTPRWDTLAIGASRIPDGVHKNDFVSTVHMPDPSRWYEIEREERDAARRAIAKKAA